MYVLRWLNAPGKPQIFQLSSGSLTLGRGPDCDIQIKDPGVSKHHVQFQVTGDKVLVQDLNSTNGTFVNGVKIQHHRVQSGDKILIHSLMFDIVETRLAAPRPSAPYVHPEVHRQMEQWQSYDQPAEAPFPAEPPPEEAPAPGFQLNAQTWSEVMRKIQHNFDDVAMPALYRLSEMTEFRVVLAGMVGIFIVVVTILATIPMANLTKSSMESESKRRALTLARYVEARNREAISQNIDSALDVALPNEEGIKAVLIVAHSDGHILAPVTRAGRYDGLPFIADARTKDRELTEHLDGDTIAASVPVRFYNPEQGAQVTGAHVIVLYDISALASDQGRIISLFVQVFVLALIIGSGLYLIMYRLIEHPIRQLNDQLDEALREGRPSVELNIQFPALETLASNISSALSRIGQGGGTSSTSQATFHSTDVENIVQMIASPALAVSGSSETIIAVNPSFEHLAGLTGSAVYNQPLDVILDQALRLNLQGLIERARQSGTLESDQLEMVSGEKMALTCKTVSVGDQVGFFLLVMNAAESEMAA